MAATVRGITLGRYSDSVDAKDDEVTLLDNKKIYLGTGSDLQLVHDGSNSIINDTGTGNLKVQVSGSDKLEVTSTGVDITGNLTVSGTSPAPNICTNNLIINGACLVAQRGTSSNAADSIVVDRFYLESQDNDETPTHEQADVASGTTPYELGFRKCWKATNGNQTSGAGASDRIQLQYRIEARDLANSGWNYTSASSFITLQFWIKSSVAQNFYGYLKTSDGTGQNYPFETGSLTADTWTKVTKTIPGNSNIQIDNDNGEGLRVVWSLFKGTDKTDPGVALNTWAAHSSGTEMPDNTSTWYTTNDATLEITGVQLELGQVANTFKYETFAEVERACERYYYKDTKLDHKLADGQIACNVNSGTYALPVGGNHPTSMRAAPTLTLSSFTYSGCAFSSSNTNGNAWGMRVTVDNTSQFRITTGTAELNAEL